MTIAEQVALMIIIAQASSLTHALKVQMAASSLAMSLAHPREFGRRPQ